MSNNEKTRTNQSEEEEKNTPTDDYNFNSSSLSPLQLSSQIKDQSQQLEIPVKGKHNLQVKQKTEYSSKGKKQFDDYDLETKSQPKNNEELLKVLENRRQKNFYKNKVAVKEGSQLSSSLPDNPFQEQQRQKTLFLPEIQEVRDSLRISQSQDRANFKVQQVELTGVQVIQKRKRKGSSIYHKESQIIKNLKSTEKQIKQRRKQELSIAKSILTGKISIIWIFLLSQVTQQCLERIRVLYHSLSTNKYVVPLVENSWEIKPFLQVPNSIFKLVLGVKNLSDVEMLKDNEKIVEIYVHCVNNDKDVSKCLNSKAECRKIKGIFFDLNKIIDRAEQQVENQIKLYHSKKGIDKRKYVSRFPSFIKLSGEDKSFATLYRANLYGAIKINNDEKKAMFSQFMNLALEKYGEEEDEKMHMNAYQKIDHEGPIDDLTTARRIIQFYVKECFYYKILNSMLRTSKTTEEFEPCILPFHQTYHSIKTFYSHQLKQSNRTIKKQTLYRGTKLRERDFNSLKKNSFIQIFGFMSTSKNLERAKEFTDHLGNIFVIHVPEMVVPSKFDSYDHGFVDINAYNLASSKFSIEEEILFNCLNVYKVLQIQKNEKDGFNYIHLEYGVIFKLLEKKNKNLTDDQKDILLNYQYCINLLDKIEDQGDVYLLHHEYEKAIFYYEEKIKQNSSNLSKYYYKLAKVQHQCGRLEQASINTRKSLQVKMKQSSSSCLSQSLQEVEIYSQNSSICLEVEDFIEADEFINEAIDLIPSDKFLEKAQKIRQRGQIKVKKGDIQEAEEDFLFSEQILKSLDQTIDGKRSKIRRDYILGMATVWCSERTMDDLKKEKQDKTQVVDDLEEEIKAIEDEINEQLIQINDRLKETALATQSKEKYDLSLKKGALYLKQIKKRKTQDPLEKAKIKVLEVKIMDYLDLNESSKLLNEAIALVQSSSGYFDQKIGEYCTLLASLQKQNLEKFSNPKSLLKGHLGEGDPIEYDEEQQKKVLEACRNNYEKALNILTYHNKQNSTAVIQIKNQWGEVQFSTANYKNSYDLLSSVKETKKYHSQVSKSCLILSKIGFARGELKNSFENIDEAERILRKALVKSEQEKYIKIFQTSQILWQIKMHRAKIYLKQVKHDLSLKQLWSIEEKMKLKEGDTLHHPLSSDIYELRAENMAGMNVEDYYDDYFKQAITLREKQIGSLNLPNAITYCNFAKYQIIHGQIQSANELLSKASEIFSCFKEDHPITWLVYYCYGLYNQKKNEKEKHLELLKSCLKRAHQKYDRSHITVNKIRYQYAKALYSSGKIQESIEELEELENDLEVGMKESCLRSQIETEQDDEKIVLEKNLYKVLQEAYKKNGEIEKEKNGSISEWQIKRCLNRLNTLQKAYSKKEDSEQ